MSQQIKLFVSQDEFSSQTDDKNVLSSAHEKREKNVEKKEI